MFLNIDKPDVSNCADNNPLYSFDKKLKYVFSHLKYYLKNVLNWFQVNSLKADPSKFQFMTLGDIQKLSFVLNIDGKKIYSFSEVELVGIVIDNRLKFKTHIGNPG